MCLGRMQRFHPEKDLDEQRVMMRVSVLRNVRRAACALNTPGGECPSGRAALGAASCSGPSSEAVTNLTAGCSTVVLTAFSLLAVALQSVLEVCKPLYE